MATENRLMKDYIALKEKYPEEILLYQVGTFYRILQDDAIKTAECLGLKLMTTGEASAPVFMCGFPKSGLDKYVGKLLRNGFAVAVCNQIKDENGGIRREVCEVLRCQ
jgi:DNA mismatch repair protein MutS